MAKNAKQVADDHLPVKITEKGAISIYGLQRFPVTLYADQWKRILAKKDKLLAFMDQHKSELSVKEEKTGGPAGSTAL